MKQVDSVGNEATNVNSEARICLNCEKSCITLPLPKMQNWNVLFEIVSGTGLQKS